MIQKDSENYRVMQYLLNVGSLTAVDACKEDVSNNLRSRVSELQKLGFDVISEAVDGKQYCKYLIPSAKVEINRELFKRHTNA